MKGTHDGPKDPDRLVYGVDIEASVEDVWDAITNPARTPRYFFNTAVRATWKIGSSITYDLPDGSHAIEGTVLEFDPPRRFAMSARYLFRAEAANEESRITWEVQARGKAARLLVIHDRLAQAPRTLEIVKGGWPRLLDGLQALFEKAPGS